jgi:hypothetical protein
LPSQRHQLDIEGAYSNRLLQEVGCNPNDEDKQGKCMQACDDSWIKATQAYNADIDKAKEAKKVCEKACGC